MNLTYNTFRLVLKDTFTLSHGSYQYRDTFIVTLSKDGIEGLGEATVIPYLGVSLDGLEQRFKEVQPSISQFKWDHPEELWKKAHDHLQNDSFLQSAIDCAAWDWYGKKEGKPVRELLELDGADLPVSSYTIGLGTIEEMSRKMKAAPWPIYKIKVASVEDLQLVTQLRSDTDAVFRLDANCSWSAEQLYENYEKLKALNVDLLEQPLPVGNENQLDKSRLKSDIPIIADESCSGPDDVAKCKTWFDGVNIKLMKCGGISPALEMIRKAKSMGLKVMGGCMTESSVGISAMAHLAPLFDYIDLDGAALLANDPAEGVVVNKGVIEFPDRPGLGCRMI